MFKQTNQFWTGHATGMTKKSSLMDKLVSIELMTRKILEHYISVSIIISKYLNHSYSFHALSFMQKLCLFFEEADK